MRGGKIPPPNRSSRMDSKIRTNPPRLREMKNADQTKMAVPKMMAKTPVARKLGTTVMAGSQLFHVNSGMQGGPIEAIIRPSGWVFPWRISK
jgi:hypothetical protein